jgi:hypothetical protein
MKINLRQNLREALHSRYDTSGLNDVQKYYDEQFYYGHREVLLKYLNISEEYYFKVILSHGNIFPDWFDPIKSRFDRNQNELLQIVWRGDTADSACKRGINATAIGAIGLYALENMGQSMETSKKNIISLARNYSWENNVKSLVESLDNKKVLYMPFHSWEGDVVEHGNQSVEILSILAENITVCLGYLDFVDPKCRDIYQKFNLKMTCAGARSTMLLDSPAGGRKNFLNSLFEIISKHDVIIADEMTTGIFYGALLGKEVGLIPKPLDIDLNYSSWRNSDKLNQFNSKVRKMWPWLSGVKCDEEKIYADISAALGIESFKDRESLLETLPIGEF